MGLRIGCDLDGTIADMETALQREAERLFGPNVLLRPANSEHLEAPAELDDETTEQLKPGTTVAAPTEKKQVLSRQQLRQLWEHVATIENFWTTLNEIEPGAVARLAALRSAHRAEVIFLTQRPDTAGETTQLQSQRWLDAQGFEFPSVYVMKGSRGRAAAALHLDIVIDDRPENCLDVANESTARPLLVWRDAPDTIPAGATRLGIQTVASIAEALERIETLTGAKRRPTLMSRVRDAIGI